MSSTSSVRLARPRVSFKLIQTVQERAFKQKVAQIKSFVEAQFKRMYALDRSDSSVFQTELERLAKFKRKALVAIESGLEQPHLVEDVFKLMDEWTFPIAAKRPNYSYLEDIHDQLKNIQKLHRIEKACYAEISKDPVNRNKFRSPITDLKTQHELLAPEIAFLEQKIMELKQIPHDRAVLEPLVHNLSQLDFFVQCLWVKIQASHEPLSDQSGTQNKWEHVFVPLFDRLLSQIDEEKQPADDALERANKKRKT